ncbi:putative retrotransposon hot spot protein (RHS) [Trypanosoma cruzi]|uniref:Putative retrotransposon hot spot protein (RHS) n=1 Tax=Trypanosoma cruzi TaxID=5693 RepID=A0A2V2VX04_TRYCR|nr:putative retrotransposon hot spot protein (RHS) [Trypanosoma cruzi]
MLASRDNILPIFFGWFALKSFTESAFAKAMATELTEFEPPTGRQAKPCVLKLAPELHPKGDEGLLPSEYEKTIRKMKYRVLHTPWAANFPLVDAFFFFSECNPRTLVGLRMTTAGGRHTTASTVRQFTECLVAYFNGWEESSRDMSWEIIYVQQADSTPMNDWRRCDAVNFNNVSDDEGRGIAALWNGKGAAVPSVNIEKSFRKCRGSFKFVKQKGFEGKMEEIIEGNWRITFMMNYVREYFNDFYIFVFLRGFRSGNAFLPRESSWSRVSYHYNYFLLLFFHFILFLLL